MKTMKLWVGGLFALVAAIGLVPPAGAVAPPVTSTTLVGELHLGPMTDIYRPWLEDFALPCPPGKVWMLTDDNGKSYELYLGTIELEKQADRLKGMRVVVRGEMKGIAVIVKSMVGEELLGGPFQKWPVPAPAPQVIGLELGEAQAVLAKMGYKVRIASVDGEAFPLTMDARWDRANLHVKAGKVVGMWIG